jgi:hypothetical protein
MRPCPLALPAHAHPRRTALGRLGGRAGAALTPSTRTRQASASVLPPRRVAWEGVPLGLVARGTEEIRVHLGLLFAANAPDIAYDLTGSFAAGDRAAAEWPVSGTLTGDFPGLPAGTGQPCSLRGRRSSNRMPGKSLATPSTGMPTPPWCHSGRHRRRAAGPRRR